MVILPTRNTQIGVWRRSVFATCSQHSQARLYNMKSMDLWRTKDANPAPLSICKGNAEIIPRTIVLMDDPAIASSDLVPRRTGITIQSSQEIIGPRGGQTHSQPGLMVPRVGRSSLFGLLPVTLSGTESCISQAYLYGKSGMK